MLERDAAALAQGIARVEKVYDGLVAKGRMTPAAHAAGFPRLVEWLAQGYAGTMAYLGERLDAYRHPSSVLPEVRSLLLLALPYRSVEPAPLAAHAGRISRYAWSDVDYHDVIHDRLRQLVAELRRLAPHARARGVVDPERRELRIGLKGSTFYIHEADDDLAKREKDLADAQREVDAITGGRPS